MRYKQSISLSILLILIILMVALILNFLPRDVSILDDQNLLYSATNLILNNSLETSHPLNKEYNTCLFSNVFESMQKSTFKTFYSIIPTNAIFYAYFLSLFGQKSLIYLNILFIPLIIIFLWLIAKRITKNITVTSILILIVCCFSVFLKSAIGIWDIIPVIFFTSVSFYIIINLNIPNKNAAILVPLFLILASSLRYVEFFYIIPLFIAFYVFRKPKRSEIILFGVIVSIFLLSILLFNLKFFGNPLFISKIQQSTYPCLNDTADSITRGIAPSFFTNIKEYLANKDIFQFYDSLIYSFNYLNTFIPLFIFLMVLGLIKPGNNKSKITILSIFLISFLLYG